MIQGNGTVWLDDVSLDGNDLGADATPREEKAEAVAKPEPVGPRKPAHSCDPGEGFYPDYPHAWQQVLEGQLQRAKQGPAAVVFLGDSLVQGWSEQPQWKEHYAPSGAVNLGVGGDGTPQLLYRIQKGVLDGLDPKVVMLSVGVNNVWPGCDAEDTVKGIRAVVAAIQAKAPKAYIVLMADFHFFDKGDGRSRKRVETINAALRKLADDQQIRLVDGALYCASLPQDATECTGLRKPVDAHGRAEYALPPTETVLA